MWISVNVLTEERPYSLSFSNVPSFSHAFISWIEWPHTLGVDQCIRIQSSSNGKATRDQGSSSFNQPQWGRMWWRSNYISEEVCLISYAYLHTLMLLHTHTLTHAHRVIVSFKPVWLYSKWWKWICTNECPCLPLTVNLRCPMPWKEIWCEPCYHG
jgi:hypothetical protein